MSRMWVSGQSCQLLQWGHPVGPSAGPDSPAGLGGGVGLDSGLAQEEPGSEV